MALPVEPPEAHPKFPRPRPIRRGGLFALVLVLLLPGLPQAGPRPVPSRKRDDRDLDRNRVEEVYRRHRGRMGAPEAAASVAFFPPSAGRAPRPDETGRMAQALLSLWGDRISAADLQAELDRMILRSRRPGMLEEIFAVLDHDPGRIVATAVWPRLVERRLRERFAADPRIHAEARGRAEACRAGGDLRSPACREGVEAVEMIWRRSTGSPEAGEPLPGRREILLEGPAWASFLGTLLDECAPGAPLEARPPRERIGELAPNRVCRLQESDDFLVLPVIREAEENSLKVETRIWRKISFEAWWAGFGRASRGEMGMPEGEFLLNEVPKPAGCVEDTWTPLPESGQVEGRIYHSAVWTGAEMIVWGGFSGAFLDSGARYDPATDSWTALARQGAPSPRWQHTAVWTGTEMIVWGGDGYPAPGSTGARYDPDAGTWAPTAIFMAPEGRHYHSAVWGGGEMLVWGGERSGVFLNTGGRYDPVSDSWRPMDAAGAPFGRVYHLALWTETGMVVWGGRFHQLFDRYTNSGGVYDPLQDRWKILSLPGAPSPRGFSAGAWSGRELIVWGGYDGAGVLGDGGRYDLARDEWKPVTPVGAPVARWLHPAIWSGVEMILWGGGPGQVGGYLNSGGRYDPKRDRWTATSTAGAAAGRAYHTAVWTGTEMLVWGGVGETGALREGGRYCGCPHPGRYYLDADADGFGDAGDPASAVFSCLPAPPPGFAATADDCDDSDPAVHPDAVEECNGRDDNCREGVDEGGDGLCPDPGRPCAAAACGGTAGCLERPANEGGACTDGSYCTWGDHCQSGTCVPEGMGSDGTVAPTLSVRLVPEVLFPPNHQMVDVHAVVAAVDACGAPARVDLLGIASSEPGDQPGEEDGHTPVDIDGEERGTPDFDFRLRAERDETGPGRIYTVRYAAEDRAGAISTSTGYARVPVARRTEPREAADLLSP